MSRTPWRCVCLNGLVAFGVCCVCMSECVSLVCLWLFVHPLRVCLQLCVPRVLSGSAVLRTCLCPHLGLSVERLHAKGTAEPWLRGEACCPYRRKRDGEPLSTGSGRAEGEAGTKARGRTELGVGRSPREARAAAVDRLRGEDIRGHPRARRGVGASF